MSYFVNLVQTQKYLEWLKTKIYLDSIADSAKSRYIERGQIYWCNFGIGVGCEMSKRKARPCVILQNNIGNIKSSNTVVAPITHNSNTDSYLVPISTRKDINGKVILDGKVNVTNIVCVSKARLGDPIGKPIIKLTNPEMSVIDKELAKNISLIKYYNDIKKKYDSHIEYIERIKKERNEAQDVINNIKLEFNNDSDSEKILSNIKKMLDIA